MASLCSASVRIADHPPETAVGLFGGSALCGKVRDGRYRKILTVGTGFSLRSRRVDPQSLLGLSGNQLRVREVIAADLREAFQGLSTAQLQKLRKLAGDFEFWCTEEREVAEILGPQTFYVIENVDPDTLIATIDETLHMRSGGESYEGAPERAL